MSGLKSSGVFETSARLVGSCGLFTRSAASFESIRLWDMLPGLVPIAFGLCILVWVSHRMRMAHLARQLNLRLEERLTERTRAAEELHDTLLQGFLSASMQLDVAAGRLPQDSPVRQQLEHILELMRTVSAEGRKTLQNLRSAEGIGVRLEEALAQIERESARQCGAPPGLRITVEGRTRAMDPLIRDEVYGIAREAILNALRHSGAKRIEVLLEYSEREFQFVVCDDGRGIDPNVFRQSGQHRGLFGIRERAERIGGQLRLWSRSRTGTRIQLSVPERIAYQSLGSDREDSVLSWRNIVQSVRALGVTYPPIRGR